MTKIVPALPAATVTLVRDTAQGVEVLMLQRNHQSGFMPGMFLFPGGAVDAGDRVPAVAAPIEITLTTCFASSPARSANASASARLCTTPATQI